MKKQELEAIFGDGEPPNLGPIEVYLHAVATKPKLPDFAVGICTARIEEAAPSLRTVLLRAADGEVLSDDESLLLFRGLSHPGRSARPGSLPAASAPASPALR